MRRVFGSISTYTGRPCALSWEITSNQTASRVVAMSSRPEMLEAKLNTTGSPTCSGRAGRTSAPARPAAQESAGSVEITLLVKGMTKELQIT